MWMRLLAMTRRPACSRRSMILPVMLRLVASGLMIEKVRSMAMDSGSPFWWLWFGGSGLVALADCPDWRPAGARPAAASCFSRRAYRRFASLGQRLQDGLQIGRAHVCTPV